MEPYTALGLAGNILQFIEFTCKLLVQVDEIRQVGNSASVIELFNVTRDFDLLAHKLEVTTNTSQPSCLSQDDQAILDMSRDCARIATQLSSKLTKITGRAGQSIRRTVRQALRTIWSEGEIQDLTKRLGMYRDQLQFRMIVMMNQRLATQAVTQVNCVSDAKASEAAILKSISDQGSISTTQLYDAVVDFRRIMEANEMMAANRHEELVTMIKVEPPALPSNSSRPDELPQLEPDSPALKYANYVQQRLIRLLRFERMLYREEDIKMAHPETFEWVLQSEWQTGGDWSNFMDWLTKGEGCYWFNGKAGSGKSTLMKYIIESTTTRRALESWAGHHPLTVASFYLWRSGSEMQKNMMGLFRKLLSDILDQRPEMMETLFPEWASATFRIIQEALRGRSGDTQSKPFPGQEHVEKPLEEDIRKAFQILLNLRTPDTRICLFIDGLDELDGDLGNLLHLLLTSRSFGVKLAVSSRPINDCVHAFRGSPQLRLQDLTKEDINIYVLRNLDQHPNSKQIESQELVKLRADIVDRSCGVFLWTVLIVRSLVTGLRNYDTAQDLRRRLDEYPPELDNLYRHMLQSMTPLYREQASQLLQIFVRAAVHGDTLHVVELFWANSANLTAAKSAPLQDFNGQKVKHQTDVMEVRLRSRCCGLLEVNGREEVAPLHRTVLDYIQLAHVWHEILTMNLDSQFNPDVSLAWSAIWMVKYGDSTERDCFRHLVGYHTAILQRHGDIASQSSQIGALLKCLRFCRLAEESQREAQNCCLEALADAAREIWCTESWAMLVSPQLTDTLSVASALGMTNSVKHYLTTSPNPLSSSRGAQLLLLAVKEIDPATAIFVHSVDSSKTVERFLNIVRMLIGAGADTDKEDLSYRQLRSHIRKHACEWEAGVAEAIFQVLGLTDNEDLPVSGGETLQDEEIISDEGRAQEADMSPEAIDIATMQAEDPEVYYRETYTLVTNKSDSVIDVLEPESQESDTFPPPPYVLDDLNEQSRAFYLYQ